MQFIEDNSYHMVHMIVPTNITCVRYIPTILFWSKITTNIPMPVLIKSSSFAIKSPKFIFSTWNKLIILLVIIILQASAQVPQCQASPTTISDHFEENFSLTQKNRISNQRGSHLISNLVSGSLQLSLPTSSKDNVIATIDDQDLPTYQKVAVGRSVTFKCGVKNIGKHRLSWFHKDRHTFLAFSDKVVLNNGRIKVSSQADTVFYLHIDNVQLTDKGQIMCQLNTVPMKSQIHTLDIVESPRIIDQLTSSNLEPVREGANVSLRCGASGLPTPDISWRREMDRTKLAHLIPSANSSNNGSATTTTNELPLVSSSTSPYLYQGGGQTKNNMMFHSDTHTVTRNRLLNSSKTQVDDIIDLDTQDLSSSTSANNINKIITVQGQYLNITRVDRRDMGFYVCIASNGVPTSVSRRIFLPVAFGPMLTPSKHQKVKPSGRDIVLYCDLESYPKAMAHWTFNGQSLFWPQSLSQKKQSVISGGNQQLQSSSSDSIKARSAAFTDAEPNLNIIESDSKYEMSIIDDVDSYNYKSILMLKIKDFQQTDYGVYICAAMNTLGEAQAKINVLPKDYTRLVPIVTTAQSIPQNMILSQHRVQQHNNGNNNSSANGRNNIFTVNGAKYIQIGAASSVSLVSSQMATKTTNNNNRISIDNNGHDLKTNTNRYNPSDSNTDTSYNNNNNNNNKIQDRHAMLIGNNSRLATSRHPSIMNDNGNNNQLENIDSSNDKLDTPFNGSDNDDNHLDLRLDLNDNNSLDLQLLHQSGSSSSSAVLIFFRSFRNSASVLPPKYQRAQYWPPVLSIIEFIQLSVPSLSSVAIWRSIYV